jgi:hypothetical protein
MYSKLFSALQSHIAQSGAVPWQEYPLNLDKPLTH